MLLRRSERKINAPGMVQPLGGKVNNNENPYVAARREVLEESGMIIENLTLEAVVLDNHTRNDNIANWLIFYFLADYKIGKIIESDEGELMSFSTVDDILKEKLWPSFRAIVKNVLNPEDGTVFATFEYDEKENLVGSSRGIIDKCALQYCRL